MFGLAQVDRLKGEACLIMTDMADIVLLILNFDLLVLWLELHTYCIQISQASRVDGGPHCGPIVLIVAVTTMN